MFLENTTIELYARVRQQKIICRISSCFTFAWTGQTNGITTRTADHTLGVLECDEHFPDPYDTWPVMWWQDDKR